MAIHFETPRNEIGNAQGQGTSATYEERRASLVQALTQLENQKEIEELLQSHQAAGLGDSFVISLVETYGQDGFSDIISIGKEGDSVKIFFETEADVTEGASIWLAGVERNMHYAYNISGLSAIEEIERRIRTSLEATASKVLTASAKDAVTP